MISERQRIEAPPPPSVDNMPPPPSYEEVNGVYASQAHNGSTDSMGYFLGEVRFFLEQKLDILLKNKWLLTLFSAVYSCRFCFPTMRSQKLNWISQLGIISLLERFVTYQVYHYIFWWTKGCHFIWRNQTRILYLISPAPCSLRPKSEPFIYIFSVSLSTIYQLINGWDLAVDNLLQKIWFGFFFFLGGGCFIFGLFWYLQTCKIKILKFD